MMLQQHGYALKRKFFQRHCYLELLSAFVTILSLPCRARNAQNTPWARGIAKSSPTISAKLVGVAVACQRWIAKPHDLNYSRPSWRRETLPCPHFKALRQGEKY